MIKLHASYSKKVPAETQYSSQSFLASMEIEVSDDLGKDGNKLHDTFSWLWGQLKQSVEAQIRNNGGKKGDNNGNNFDQPKDDSRNKGSSNGNGKKASNKQVKFLIGLAKGKGQDFNRLKDITQDRFGKGVYDLAVSEASTLIDEFKNGK